MGGQKSKEPCKKEACDIQACLTKNNFMPQSSPLCPSGQAAKPLWRLPTARHFLPPFRPAHLCPHRATYCSALLPVLCTHIQGDLLPHPTFPSSSISLPFFMASVVDSDIPKRDIQLTGSAYRPKDCDRL
ncbi:hypothetical protein Taro_003482 [Colocasia esculenta]|uniref:Uncharacterized protein n=1 Tax=Colocasia esculenta TaxID=4460 RepID=A0A843TRV4_COLES|nr:hypothetical protein [Colocasia esculenta]